MPTDNKQQVQMLQGKNSVFFFRILKNAEKEPAQLIPYLTSGTYNLSRSATTTQTKSGNVVSIGEITSTLSANFEDAIANCDDDIRESLLHAEKVEVWQVNLDRINAKGEYYAIYAQGYVTADNSTAAPNANVTRAVTFTVSGTPKEGWTQFDESTQQELDYVFRGVGEFNETNNGEGEAWSDSDRGTGSNDRPASAAGDSSSASSASSQG